ncbi:MAG: ABC transporter ATP-binding protein [Bacteroidales bacterium]|nr:ABC transporter ATP-binding protein [Bacteroidales bacterium]
MPQAILKVDGLRKSYHRGGRDVLTGLDITIPKGEVYGLLGPNGVGKTTTVSIITGLLEEDAGQVELFGLPSRHNKKIIMKRVGVVPQSIALFPELTATENLRVFGSVYGIPRATLDTRIDEMLALFGLSDSRNKRVETFSGGMKRCMNMIVGIMHHPEFLILDEPTVGIDVQSKVKILDHLKLLNQQGTTILYTSHDMEEAEHLCTKVGIIYGGRLAAEGTPEGLIGRFPDCRDLQSAYLKIIA